MHADSCYTGLEKRAEIVALERKMDWQIAGKRGPIKAMAEGGGEDQGTRAGVCGTSLPHREEYFPALESAVSGAGQKGA